MNTFGQTLTLTTFGESHGPAIGGIIDGLPAGIAVDRQLVAVFMARRRPGASALVSGRAETDRVEILSGISDDGRSLGTPIGFIIPNTDSRPRDYDNLKDVFRPNHADFTYQMKYGLRDHRGGGRASARETAVRVAAAAIVYPLGLVGLLVMAVFAASYALLGALAGLTLGVKMPVLTWTDQLMPIKQSAPVMLTLFGGMGYTILLFAGFLLLPGWRLGFAGYAACFAAANLLLCAVLHRWLRKKGAALFAAL